MQRALWQKLRMVDRNVRQVGEEWVVGACAGRREIRSSVFLLETAIEIEEERGDGQQESKGQQGRSFGRK